MKNIGTVFITVFILALLATINLPVTASAAPSLQLTEFPTPTPNAVGQVLYTVQDGDTLWRISAVSGVPIDELRNLNQVVLGSDDVVSPGMILVLSIGGSAPAATIDPNVTPVETLLPTATIGESTGIICVFLYEDTNGDSLRQDNEISIAGGAVSITERLGKFSSTENTAAADIVDDGIDEDEICFGAADSNGDSIPDGIPAGEYNITVAIPDGYNPTTELSKTIELSGGQTSNLRMGAQPSSQLTTTITGDQDNQRSPLFGILGIGLILGSFGLIFFAVQRSRTPSISRR